ncbi:MAG: hypothetical protein R2741_07795 [Methanolobus sp.]
MRIIAIGLIVFLLCVSVAGASATDKEAELSLVSAEDLGYKIIPAKSDDGGVGVRTCYRYHHPR